MIKHFFPFKACCHLLFLGSSISAFDDTLVEKANTTIDNAAHYFQKEISVHGGYVYFYSLKTGVRWGEGKATAKQIWVQPPGTPTVGMAFLKAFQATGDPRYLQAARDAAKALVYGQLKTGGWQNQIDMSGLDHGHRYSGGRKRKDGFSSLDDGQTQSALRLVMRVDHELKFRDQQIHDSSMLALDSLLAAQFSNGGFPQGWRGPVSEQLIKKARYPDYDWRTQNRIKNYWDMYTLNDNVCGYVADVLIDAFEIYEDRKFLKALRRLGDFLILAQMPEPQPAWAQQYDYEMNPIWARRFEPAAIAGDESQEVIQILMKIYLATGDKKYLSPIPAALTYLESSLLKDGRIARYYELKSNKPLYMVRNGKQYTLTYNDSKLPGHYGWKWDSKLNLLKTHYELLEGGKTLPVQTPSENEVRKIIRSLDSKGRWVKTHDGKPLVGQAKMSVGEAYISSEEFSKNMNELSDYLIRMRNQD